MKLKTISLKIANALLITCMVAPQMNVSAGVIDTQNDTYVNYINIDTKDLSLILDENNIKTQIKNKSIGVYNEEQKDNLDEAILENIHVKNALIEAIESNLDIIAVSYSEYFVEEGTDKNNEAYSKLLTNKEVEDIKRGPSVIPGQAGGRFKLTLTSLLTVNSSIVGVENTYSLYGSANWDNSGFHTEEGSPHMGDDVFGFTWQDDYYTYGGLCNISGTYNHGNSIDFGLSQLNYKSGLAWTFKDYIPNNGVYMGAESISGFTYISINPKNTESLKTFTTEYVHTYEDKKPTVSIVGGITPTISVTDVEKNWKVISPISARIK